jgi:5-methylcytosine-specific restriction protein A
MPARAFRPYAADPVAKRERFDAQRIDDPIRKLYQTKTWRAVRRIVLARDPFCMIHPADGVPALSAIVHHVIAARKYVDQHGGDEGFFFDESNLQGVCKPCHDAHTAKECGFAPVAGSR